MQAVIFDLDETIFTDGNGVYDDVDDLLRILRRLGIRIGALTRGDHRMLVRLEEAGIRQHFDGVVCTAHIAEPKQPRGVYHLLDSMRADPAFTVLISHADSDMTLGKDAGVAKTIYVMHGPGRHESHRHADHTVENIARILDVLE